MLTNFRFRWKTLSFCAALYCFLAASAIVSGQTVKYYSWEPRVIDPESNATVTLTVVTIGAPTAVRIERPAGTTQQILPLIQVGPNNWRFTMESSEFRVEPAMRYQGGLSYQGELTVYVGNNRVFKGSLDVPVRTAAMPDMPIRQISAVAQMSPHIVNMRDDTLYFADNIGIPPDLLRRFYQLRGDDFDFVAIVGQVPPYQNRYYQGLRNNIGGTGQPLFDSGAAWGSASRLQGLIAFPMDSFFSWSDSGAVHEVGHRWCCFLNLPALTPGRPHWTLSDLAASGLMGYSGPTGQGFQFPFTLTPVGSDYRLDYVQPQYVFNDLELYLMGLIPKTEVVSHFSFRDQSQSSRALPGAILNGPVDTFTIDDVIARDGPRTPAFGAAQTAFRAATIVLSQNRLLSPNEMAYFDHQAHVGEALSPIPPSPTKPFFTATGGRATLSTTVCPECGQVPRVPVRSAIVSGDRQTGPAGTVLPLPFVFQVTDQIAGPLAGVPVRFDAGNATVSPSTLVTDSRGQGSVTVTLGSAPGSALVSVLVGDLSPLIFLATVTPPVPSIQTPNILNGASFRGGPIAPGEIVTLYPSGMTGPAAIAGTRLNSLGLVDTTLADTRVLFDGLPAPMIYVAQNQIGAVVPYGVRGPQARVVVEYRGIASAPAIIDVAPSAPALFTAASSGSGQAAALNEDGTLNAVAAARRGSIMVFYATGEGRTDPAGVDGKPAALPLPHPLLPATLTVGGRPARILYIGGAPGLVAGALQINAQLDDNTPSGPNVEVTLRIGSTSSPPGVTVSVQ